MGLRVLVVDDDRSAADGLSAHLAAGGRCEVRTAYSGADALAVAVEFKPHACFVDLHMPGLDGYAVAAGLRALPRPPRLLVCMAGSAADGQADRVRAAGFHLLLTKPVSLASATLVVLTAAPFAAD
jgi:CheY-like chemotaxis protein